MRNAICLLLISAGLMFTGLNATRLWDDDEGYFAGTAAEMHARGEWIVPTFNGELFAHKPPFMYWTMRLGFFLFGVNELGARCGSALFGVATVWLTYRLGRRWFDERTGWIAGVALACSWMFSVVAHAATPDLFLTFFCTLALGCFAEWGFLRSATALPPDETAKGPASAVQTAPAAITHWLWPQKSWQFAVIYAICGVGVLTKGPIGLLLPMAVMGLFLLTMAPLNGASAEAGASEKSAERCAAANVPGAFAWRSVAWSWTIAAWRRFGPKHFLRCVWRLQPWVAVAIVAAIAGPWYLAVGQATDGAFWSEFFGVHHWQRFTTAMENHSGPPYYYVLAILAGMFPASVFAVPAALVCYRGAIADSPQRRALVFLACWAGVFVGIFSLASTKLPNYVLPAYPALALGIGYFGAQWWSQADRLPRGWMIAALGVLMVVGGLFAFGAPQAASLRFDGVTLLDRAGLAADAQTTVGRLGRLGWPMILGGGIALALLWNERLRSALVVTGCTSIIVTGTLWAWGAPQLRPLQSLAEVTRQTHRLAAPDRVAAFGFFRPSLVFYAWSAGRPAVTEGSQPAAANPLCWSRNGHSDSAGPASILPALRCEPRLKRFLAAPAPAYLITTAADWNRLRAYAPELQIVARRSRFPEKGELLIVTNRAEAVARNASPAAQKSH